MDIRLPSGKVLKNVPDGTTKEQIRSRYPAEFKGAPKAEPFEFSAMETLKNTPGSLLQLGSDMVQPFVHPIDTAKGLYNIASGGVQKMIPGEQGNEAAFDTAKKYYKDRYGSVEKAMQAFQKDPAGVLSDISMGGGLLAKAGRSSKLGAAARAIDPVNAAVNTGLLGVSKLIDKGRPAKMYNEAAKINYTKRRTQKDIDKMVNTALDEQIMPTQSGLDKLNDIVSGLNDQIDTAIDAATDASGTISKDALFKYMSALRKKMGGVKANAPNDLAAIDRVVGAFNEHLEKSGKTTLTARELQDFKKDAYKQIDFDRSQLKSDRAVDKTKQAMARAAKEGVEQLVPDSDIQGLNAREGNLLNLKDSLQRSAGRIERRDNIGIGVPIKGLAGQAVAGPLGGAVGLMQGIFDAPKVKAAAALALHRAQQGGAGNIMSTGRLNTPLRQGLLESAQLSREEQERLRLLQQMGAIR